LGWVTVAFTDVGVGLLATATPAAGWGVTAFVFGAPAMLVGDWFVGAAASAVMLLTVFVAAGLAETVVMLLGAALAITGVGEFCVVVVIVLVLALGDALAWTILTCEVVLEPAGALVAIFITLVVGLAGLATAFTMVVVVVEEAGDVFVVVFPEKITFVVFAELVGGLLLAIEVEPPPEPNEPAPELVAKVNTGEELVFIDEVELKELGEVESAVTTGATLVVVDWGEIAAQGGPPEHPVITNWPLTKLRL
jgi:hypothetical protein